MMVVLLLFLTMIGYTIVMHRQTSHARARALEAERVLREANRQIDEFLSTTSHELRTPLTSILGYVQLTEVHVHRMIADLDTSEQNTKLAGQLDALDRFLQRADQKVLHLTWLVNNLLIFSRIQLGQFVISRTACDLTSLIADVVNERNIWQATRVIHFNRDELQAHSAGRVSVMADRDAIAQVVTHYLTNALRFAGTEHPIETGLQVVNGMARVWVRDSGPGVPSEEHELIWKAYHHAPGIRSQQSACEGLGLGLAISRSIIEQHDGQVGVESHPDQGAMFWFTLPLAESPKSTSMETELERRRAQIVYSSSGVGMSPQRKATVG